MKLDSYKPQNPNFPKLVVLKSGERLEFRGEDDRGIHTDAGIHDWSECLGLKCYCGITGGYVSVPFDN